MNEDTIIREMREGDDTYKTAQLTFETAPGLFRALFGRRKKAVLKIEALIKLGSNIFSHRNILAALNGGEISGVLIGYDTASVNKGAMNEDLKQRLSFFARLRFWMIIRFSRHIMDYSDIPGFYIQDLCVDPACRGKGIGRGLLEYCIARSREKGTGNVYLDVESKNETALNLYTSMGFETVRKINIKIAGITLYRMRRPV